MFGIFDQAFFKDFLSNFCATLFGAVVGIPIALYINRVQQRNSERSENAKAQIEAKTRKKKILDLLRRELDYNYDLFASHSVSIGFTEDSFNHFNYIANKPNDESWKAYSDGGELHWIDDAKLLNLLASAYHSIRQVRDSGQLLVKAAYIDHPRGGKVITEYIQKQFDTDIAIAMIDLKQVLDEIDKQNLSI